LDAVAKGKPADGRKFRFVNPEEGWIAGGPNLELYVTRDAGTTWRRIDVATPHTIPSDLSPVYDLPTFVNETTGYMPVVYESSVSWVTPMVLYKTEDGGRNWHSAATLSPLPDTRPWAPHPSAVVDGKVLTASLSAGHLSLTREEPGIEPNVQSSGASAPGSTVDSLSFVNPQRGWILATYWMLSTNDGGLSWTNVTPDPVETVPPHSSSDGAPLRSVRPIKTALPGATLASSPGAGTVSSHLGFDTFPTPPLSGMKAWSTASPYYDVYIYLYGSPNKSTNTAYYATKQWLSTVEGTYGWGVIPIWFGLQSSCVNDKTNITQFINTSPAIAKMQGKQQADSAVFSDQSLGITGGIIYVDIESYTPDGSTCSLAVQAYVNAFVTEIHSYSGYLVGVYANPAPINSDIHNQSVAQADAIWITKTPPKGSSVPSVAIWNQGISDNFWPNGQRMHQFLFNQPATFGGAGPINIDPDIDNGPVLNANNGSKVPASYTLKSYDYPGSLETWAYGINDIWGTALIGSTGNVGQIVGFYWDSTGTSHGFLFDGLVAWTSIDYPGARETWAVAINNAGLVVGAWEDSTGIQHGFIYDSVSGAITSFDYPGSTLTQAWGINDAGQIAGWYYDASGGQHGFVYYTSKSAFKSIDYPGIVGLTQAFGINGDAAISGSYFGSGLTNSFIDFPVPPAWTGPFTSFSRAGALATWGYGIDNDNDLSGSYELSQTNIYTFVLYNDVLLSYFQYPGSSLTYGQGINDFGQVVGGYQDSNQKDHMFVAIPQF
jgi:hypothetical protein